MIENGISVIILTWNGIDLIRECVSHVIDSVCTWPIPTEIILVDNGSQDGTVEYVRTHWPTIKIVAFDSNLGFSRANNRAVSHATFDHLLFLNNDLILEDDFILPLIEHLKKKDIFAVAPKMLRWDRKTIDDGLRYGKFDAGLFDVKLERNPELVDIPHFVTFFCGACFLCQKRIFLELGGFDEIYSPYAWEDLDLSYRAWKRGYRVIYEPKAVCFHKREATTRPLFSNIFFISLMWRNKFFFMWKNLTYKPFVRDHFICLPWKLCKFLCNGRWRYVIGFLRALCHLPSVLILRKREQRYAKLDDRMVISQSYKMLK